MLFRTLDALRAFDIMFVLTGGGPAGTTETLTVYAYRASSRPFSFGFGSAMSVIVFALVMVVAAAYLGLLRRARAPHESPNANLGRGGAGAAGPLGDPVLLAGPHVVHARGRAARRRSGDPASSATIHYHAVTGAE